MWASMRLLMTQILKSMSNPAGAPSSEPLQVWHYLPTFAEGRVVVLRLPW